MVLSSQTPVVGLHFRISVPFTPDLLLYTLNTTMVNSVYNQHSLTIKNNSFGLSCQQQLKIRINELFSATLAERALLF